MGLWLEDAITTDAVPRSWALHRTFDAADGHVLYHVYRRRNGVAYRVLRALFRVARFFYPEAYSPAPWELMGVWSDRARAAAQAERIVGEGRGKAIVCPVAVDRAFPDEIVRWRGAYAPGRRREREAPQELFVMVEAETHRAQLTELREWRAGKREADGLGKLAEALSGMERRLADFELRLDAVEKNGGRHDARWAGGG